MQAAALRRWSVQGAVSWGIFNCRKIAGTDQWSVHAEGRAIDLAPDTGGTELGQEICDAIVRASWELGLQRVIWLGRIWDLNRPAGAPFDDGGAHDTHLHVEMHPEPAVRLTFADAAHALSVSPEDLEEITVDHIVRWGGLWLVAQDLSSKTPLASSADVVALQASGRARVTNLSPGQMTKIPTVEQDGQEGP